MKSAASIQTVIIAVIALAASACTRTSEQAWPARHVVFISMDTTRADHFGFMGNERVKTPWLDAVARESIVFTDYMTVVPTTLASHTSLFTGKYPHSHGTPRNGFIVNRDNMMLTEILKGQGFHTAGFIGSFALDRRCEFNQGFDHYDEDFEVSVSEIGVGQNQRSAQAVTDAVVGYLDATGVPERLFLFVHYFDPHKPYSAPPPFDSAYDPQGRADIPDLGELRRSTPEALGRETPVARRYALQYAAEISYMDYHIGRLVADLRRRGILDSALLSITSDHGENFWEHDKTFDHGSTVYQTTMHAVSLLRLPGGRMAGTHLQQLTASIDILPTVLEFLGVTVPTGIDGKSVVLTRTGEPLPSLARYGQATDPWRGVETDPRWNNMLKSRFVREGRFKFIQTPHAGTEELYDIGADESEQTNLLATTSAETAAVAARLRPKLEAWAASADPLPSRFEPSFGAETAARLRSLGYLQ